MIDAKIMKEHLFTFRVESGGTTYYMYETNGCYFCENRPSAQCLRKKSEIKKRLPAKKLIIENPWTHWSSNNPEMITSKKNDIPINYLKTTEHKILQKEEDIKLLDVYSEIIEHHDITKSFGFEKIKSWHRDIFNEIYPFAGKTRTVEMTKGKEDPWTWRLSFLKMLPELDRMITDITGKDISIKNKKEVFPFSIILAELISEFLFIHPFREGNGRISRLIADVILARNGLPMIGMNIKTGQKDYIERIHQGYNKNYKPLAEIIYDKIIERL